MKKDIRIVGSGGQGVILASVILANAFGLFENYEIVQTQSYGPEARGGACKSEVIFSDKKIDYIKVDKPDIFIAFNEIGLNKYKNLLQKQEGVVLIIDSTFIDDKLVKDFKNVFKISATELANNYLKPFVANVVMLGFLAKVLPELSISSLESAIKNIMNVKMRQINLEALKLGFKGAKL